MPPVALIGFDNGRKTCCPGSLHRFFRLFADRAPCHGRLIRMEQARIQQTFSDQGRAACRIEIRGVKSAARLQIGKQGNLAIDLVEIVDAQLARRLRARWPADASTALVEPPVVATAAIAFSSDLRVMICSGGDRVSRDP